jgi:deoxyribodipyrimidine photo-lyase
MIDGLAGVKTALDELNIPFVCRVGTKEDVISEVAVVAKPAAVYVDYSPLRHARKSVEKIVGLLGCPVYEVDTHNIVPVWITSDKQEYAARTIRPKIHRHLSSFLVEPGGIKQQAKPAIELPDSVQLREAIEQLDYKPSGINHGFESGERAAQKMLADFVTRRLKGYAERRNDPSVEGLSNLSPYIHFGQLSSLQAVLHVYAAVAEDRSLQQDADAFIEEVVVRKELSDNWCHYNEHYDSLGGAPQWAKNTLAKHAGDEREHLYSLREFEQAQTHDAAWNAAQRQLTTMGKMHGYMRMYWAKKVLEWSASPEVSHQYIGVFERFLFTRWRRSEWLRWYYVVGRRSAR